MENNNNDKTIYHIYYGDKNSADTKHAKRVGKIRGVVLHAVDSAKHTVAKLLVKDGTASETGERSAGKC